MNARTAKFFHPYQRRSRRHNAWRKAFLIAALAAALLAGLGSTENSRKDHSVFGDAPASYAPR
jgi:hypothetical protein